MSRRVLYIIIDSSRELLIILSFGSLMLLESIVAPYLVLLEIYCIYCIIIATKLYVRYTTIRRKIGYDDIRERLKVRTIYYAIMAILLIASVIIKCISLFNVDLIYNYIPLNGLALMCVFIFVLTGIWR